MVVNPYGWTRNWVNLLATPKREELREPQVPEVVHPEAYIEWGDVGDFLNTFRQEATDPGGVRTKPKGILNGTMYGESRTFEEFTVTNPMDSSQSIKAFRTTQATFRHPLRDEDTKLYPEVVFSFSYAGGDQYPLHFNSLGEQIEPVVIGPLERIIDVHWGGIYVLISLLGTDYAGCEAYLELLDPPTRETSNDSDLLSQVTAGAVTRDNEDGTLGDAFIHHEEHLEPQPPYSHIHTVEGSSISFIVDRGNTVSIAITEESPYAGQHDKLLRQQMPEKPDALIDPWVWIDDSEGNNWVGTKTKIIAIPTGGRAVVQRLLNPFDVLISGAAPEYEIIIVKFYRKKYLAYEERYYRPYAYWVGGIDISGIIRKHANYMVASQSGIRVGVHVNFVPVLDSFGKPEGNPNAKARWATYRGRIDSTELESAYNTIQEGPFEEFTGGGESGKPLVRTGGGPFDPETASPEAVWDWLLIPNPPNDTPRLTNSAELKLPEQLPDLDTVAFEFVWDILKGGKPHFG